METKKSKVALVTGGYRSARLSEIDEQTLAGQNRGLQNIAYFV